jgi:hypothetical protein
LLASEDDFGRFFTRLSHHRRINQRAVINKKWNNFELCSNGNGKAVPVLQKLPLGALIIGNEAFITLGVSILLYGYGE